MEKDLIKQLGRKLQEQARSVGLELVAFSYVPSLDDDHDAVHAVYTLSLEDYAETAAEPDEQAAYDDTFAQMMREQRQFEEQEKAQEVRQSLKNMLAEGQGFLDP